jgi:hypothetical protein
MNIINQKLLEPVSKFPVAFLLLILAAGNVYQYVDTQKRDSRKDLMIERLNQEIKVMNEKSYEVEKERALRYEYLLNTLPKITTNEQKKSNR